MTMRMTIIASGALLALSACGRGGEAPAGNTMTSAETNMEAPAAAPTADAAQTFANAAAASDAFEIATSKLALANSSSAAVKSYANKMIAAHTTSTEKLKAAAAPMTADPALNPAQQQQLDQLADLKGSAFDTAYIAGQTAGHQEVLDVLKAYSATGEAPQLTSFATTMIPTVTAHLNMVKGLKP